MPTASQSHPPLPVGPVSASARRLFAVFVVVALALGGLGVSTGSARAAAGDGQALAWGFNDDGATVVPSSLAGKDVIAISSLNGHVLALTSDGQVTGWGDNSAGQTDTPASLDGKTVTAIAAGCGLSLALTSDGKLTAWGASGQTDIPASLADKTVTAIAGGCGHSLALASDGKLTAWGNNDHGQSNVPAALADKTVTAISAGLQHSMAVTSEGRVFAWGYNGDGETNVPSFLNDMTVTAVAAGFFHSVALTSDGQLIAWGSNGLNQLNLPWEALEGKTVVAIAAGGYDTLALTSEGQVIAWGHNGQCQLCAPTPPPGMGYISISGGHLHNTGVIATILDFEAGTDATIEGKAQVGQTLVARAGDVAPVPDSFRYRWFADGSVIPDATGPTYTLPTEVQSAAISVEISALKIGYHTSTDTSAATGPVTGTRVTGATTVGNTLRGDSSAVTSSAPATLAKQWLRNGAPIPNADGASYQLTNADAGSTIAYRVTETIEGETDAPVTSPAVGPVSGGVITLPAPTIAGDPVVDSTLSASLPGGELDPADAVVTWQWFRWDTPVGTGNTYTPVPDDVGAYLSVRATATKDYFTHVSQFTETWEVGRATFGTPPVATITGTVKVDEVLTAGAGTVAPEPDSLGYQWYADGDPIADATDPTYTLTPAQEHSAITVAVNASRAGYWDAGDLSDPTADVASDIAPDLQLDTSDATLRRGQSAMLTWTSAGAESVTASGAWTGSKATSGSLSVSPAQLGATSYVLEATNENGTTVSQVDIAVTRPAKALDVTAPKGLHLTGGGINISARGLEPGEPYTFRIRGTQVATGNANSAGSATRRVTVPSRRSDGTDTVTVTGSTSDRTGQTRARVVTNKALGIRVAKRNVRKGHRQWVMVSGLASHEAITIRFRGNRVSPLHVHASALGRYRVRFGVGMRRGTHAIVARGQFAGRTATTTFWVRP